MIQTIVDGWYLDNVKQQYHDIDQQVHTYLSTSIF